MEKWKMYRNSESESWNEVMQLLSGRSFWTLTVTSHTFSHSSMKTASKYGICAWPRPMALAQSRTPWSSVIDRDSRLCSGLWLALTDFVSNPLAKFKLVCTVQTVHACDQLFNAVADWISNLNEWECVMSDSDACSDEWWWIMNHALDCDLWQWISKLLACKLWHTINRILIGGISSLTKS